MKGKHLIGFLLILIGTNTFCFATTRYWTTRYVVTRAQERLDVALKKEGLWEQVHPVDGPSKVSLMLAISLAGGMYYWWNEGLIYWGAGFVLTAAGVLVSKYEPRKKNAAA
jgi:hypothetical protein